MEREARRELERLASEGIDGFRASLWLATLAYLADASSALGEETDGGDRLPGARGRWPGEGLIGHVVACYGFARPLPRHVGGDAGRRRRADHHFERAMARTGRWAQRRGWRTPPTRTPLPARPGRRSPSGRRRWWPRRPPCRADWDDRRWPGSARRALALPTAVCPTSSPRVRSQYCSSSPPASAIARSARNSRSADIRWLTMCAASCAKPVREPHRGSLLAHRHALASA